MRIAIFQTKLVWESPKENRNLIQEYIDSCDNSYELLILPEMFTSGFTMNTENVAEPMNGETIQWMQFNAKNKNSAIIGSLVIVENGNYFNRLVFVFPNGEIEYYDKRHLFTLAGEEKVYKKGTEKLIVEYKGWRICPLVCYDLRFPVFSRNVENYDLLIYVANWPKPRINAWNSLLKARAIENLSYVIGVNRIGLDANGMEYIGSSQVNDYLGDEIINCKDEQGIFIVEINKEEMQETRNKLNFLNDKDVFKIEL
ncbi:MULTISPECIES: amidohydrolase [Flavobacterium]|uniref:Amidohydrolase n=1 Tax=Flavobacterium jumunjinense TaxID=998845 RepID=A0ABV5GPI0_9FLAO|nr:MULTISPECIES: amidohydrolase [Flavobacterium]